MDVQEQNLVKYTETYFDLNNRVVKTNIKFVL